MSEPLRFGLVGAGRIAQAYAQVFAASTAARRSPAWPTSARGRPAPWPTASAARPSQSDASCSPPRCPVDAVIVCTPPATHPEVSLHFLRRGIHVLCEKPLSIDVSSAPAMVDGGAPRRARCSPWPRSSATSTT